MQKFESSYESNKTQGQVQGEKIDNMDFLANDTKYLRAKERVAEIRKFYGSLISYVIFISFLAGLNYYIDEWRNPWFLWAAFGWGIGIVFKALKAFPVNSLLFGKDWEARKIKEFMNEEDSSNKWD